jgi:hypothetical protein
MCTTVDAMSNGVGWSRNLYERTNLPDNYTPDDCFLAAIQRNKNVNRYNFGQCCSNACGVTLQLCSVVLFLVSYAALNQRWTSSTNLLLSAVAAAAAGYLFLLKSPRALLRSSDLRHVGIFLAFGFGLAPVLYKLTDTISTDTIHSMSYAALFLHLLAHNYHAKASAYSSNAFSLNAALFASVCLASRLDSSWNAFVLLTVAVVTFVLFPILRTKLDREVVIPATAIASVVTFSLASRVSTGFSMGVLVLLLFVTILAPLLFVRWQHHKDTIHGPWDEAIPNIK